MKIKKLICPKCGNTKKFRVDVQSTHVSTSLVFNENEAELDTDFPNDVDIMCPTCAICGTELDMTFNTEPNVLCPSCLHYINADVVETCPRKNKHYPECFMWLDEEAELL